jgi:hypothetical protein
MGNLLITKAKYEGRIRRRIGYGGKKGKETSKVEKAEERLEHHSQKSILVSSTARTREAAAGRPQPLMSQKTVLSGRLLFTAQKTIHSSSPYALRVIRSAIHGLGVRAGKNIPCGRKIIEYAGERISRIETRRRFLHGSPGRKRGLNYLAQLDAYWTVDGAVDGNGAELINHSCEPNLKLRKLRGHLWLFSLRRIRAGEELCYDYGFAKSGKRVRCRCGAARCRGTINRS